MKLIIDVDKEEYDILMLWKDYPTGLSWAKRLIVAGVPFDNLRDEIDGIEINGQIDKHTLFIKSGQEVKKIALEIIDKYRAGSEGKE